MTCRCGAALHPDPHPAELRAGKLRWRGVGCGHSAYTDVPPIMTPAERALDDAVAGLRDHREEIKSARPVCDTCGDPMMSAAGGKLRHARCVPEADMRRQKARRAGVRGPDKRVRVGGWSPERIAQLRALWLEGASIHAMGRALGISPKSVSVQVSALRLAGHDFPRRRRLARGVVA